MEKFGYKNYLTKSLIKENNDIEEHNNILRDFLSTMRYGNLPVKQDDNGMWVSGDDTHTSFYIERRCQFTRDYDGNEKRNNEYICDYTFNVYTLSYDTKRTTCKFDISKEYFFKKTYSEIITLINGKWLPYKDVDNYCSKLITNLGLNKRNTTKTNNNSFDNFDSQLAKDIYNKSSRLQNTDIEKTDDNKGIQDPKFIKKSSVQFKVQDMIGDNIFRSINATKQKAESSLINWQKTAYVNDEENLFTVACDVLHVALENSISNKASDKIELDKNSLGSKYNIDTSKINLHELDKLLSVYPPELLSPLVFLSMDNSIKWGKEGSKTSKEILNYIFGDDSVFKKGLISFDTSIGGELVDSEVAIPSDGKYKKIGISTKGGLNGHGSQASLISIFRLLFDKETRVYDQKRDKFKTRGHVFTKNINDLLVGNDLEENIKSFIKQNCSQYGIEMFNDSPTEISIILLFGGLPPTRHVKAIETILKRGKLFGMNITLPGKNDIRTEFCNFVNTHFNVTNIVMGILNRQKYDFAQINSLPKLNSSTFNYEWSVQYPAHFEGNVKLETRSKGIGFHIYG